MNMPSETKGLRMIMSTNRCSGCGRGKPLALRTAAWTRMFNAPNRSTSNSSAIPSPKYTKPDVEVVKPYFPTKTGLNVVNSIYSNPNTSATYREMTRRIGERSNSVMGRTNACVSPAGCIGAGELGHEVLVPGRGTEILSFSLQKDLGMRLTHDGSGGSCKGTANNGKQPKRPAPTNRLGDETPDERAEDLSKSTCMLH